MLNAMHRALRRVSPYLVSPDFACLPARQAIAKSALPDGQGRPRKSRVKAAELHKRDFRVHAEVIPKFARFSAEPRVCTILRKFSRRKIGSMANFGIKVVTTAIRFYQEKISVLLSPSCRYYPSCSHYLEEAMRSQGLFLGCFKGIIRILRCNPFFAGGYDPVKNCNTNQKV